MTSELQTTPEELWSELDDPWREAFRQGWEAFRQGWEAFRTGNVPVGACASTPDGVIVHAARNRVADKDAPPGEVFGSALAHAEANVMARLPYRLAGRLVLTTTLEPCIQCSAAIRLGPVATVRYAGADLLWEGCHDFSPLSPREAARPAKVTMAGPRSDDIGAFATLMSRLGPGLVSGPAAEWLRASGHGFYLDLALRLQESGEARRLVALEVDEAFGYLWPRLQSLRDAQVLGNGEPYRPPGVHPRPRLLTAAGRVCRSSGTRRRPATCSCRRPQTPGMSHQRRNLMRSGAPFMRAQRLCGRHAPVCRRRLHEAFKDSKLTLWHALVRVLLSDPSGRTRASSPDCGPYLSR
jgi:tRNA(adenine34) deaminase